MSRTWQVSQLGAFLWFESWRPVLDIGGKTQGRSRTLRVS